MSDVTPSDDTPADGGIRDPLPDPVVPPEAYSEEYYRQACAGFAEWSASEGANVASIYPGVLHLARFRPGEVLVDIGTGRGELLAVAVEQGAERAIGVEYAPAAVALAQQTLDVHGVTARAEVIQADARSIPVEGGVADVVTMIDVVEHLTDDELRRSLEEAKRLLKPGGRIFVHTMPNRIVYDVTYRLQRSLWPGRRKRWPSDPRVNEYEHLMHVNEQTLGSLKRYLDSAGYDEVRCYLGRWIHTTFVPDERAKRLYHRLARYGPTKRFGIADLFGEGRKPA